MMPKPVITTLVLVAMLGLLTADFTVGCGPAYVYGRVTQKFSMSGKETDKFILVNGQSHVVPMSFFTQVQVGDTVRFDGRQWAIVKKRDAPATQPTPLA